MSEISKFEVSNAYEILKIFETTQLFQKKVYYEKFPLLCIACHKVKIIKPVIFYTETIKFFIQIMSKL